MPPLEDGEEVLLIVRRHWWVVLAETFFVVVLAAIPIFIYEGIYAISVFQSSEFIVDDFKAFFTFCYSLWLLCLWMVFFLIWTDYFLDVWIVTNKRIIDIEQKRLFHREVSTLSIYRIQDLTVETKGIVATFLKFGNVIVQTAEFQKGEIGR